MADRSIKSLLLRAKELSFDEIELLESLLLERETVRFEECCKRFAYLPYRCHKKARHHRAVNVHGAHWENVATDSGDTCAISYLTDETKRDIREFPSFSRVTNWTKNLAGLLMEFTFMNLLIYLVYGREKTFDMQSMKAFRSLKVYKFFLMAM